ncbi:MAG: DEAD/DEAH box helicase [Candidatus Heimdallarchaeaceae archaeon]
MTEIQEQAIPKILENGDIHVLAQAKTGTGKTLSFSIPLAEKLTPKLKEVQAVIIVPTRELCKQVHNVITQVTKYRRLKTVEVYGGVSINRQIDLIRSGAQIVIATPGRLMDLYYRGEISFKNVKFVVLDEADRMLDMGFLPDIEFILFEAMKGVRPKLMLFSATIMETIKEIAEDFTFGQELLEIDVSHDSLTVENCKQYYYKVSEQRYKYSSFVRILKKEKPQFSIIFVNTKKMADILNNRLNRERDLRLKTTMLHGNMTQRQREIVASKFRKKQINCLIATNVAARGLDFPHITHIFNYDLPNDVESYVHRIGRASRMGNNGTAISIIVDEEKQRRKLYDIETFIAKDIKIKVLHSQKYSEKGSQRRQPKSKKKVDYTEYFEAYAKVDGR